MSQMEKTLTAAVVQMSSTDDVAYNLEQARHWVTEAARAGATAMMRASAAAAMTVRNGDSS